MNPGLLRHRVTLLQPAITRDAVGGEVKSFAAVRTVWADVSPLRMREFVMARAGQVEIEITMTMRYTPTVRPEWRARWNGDDYDIVSVLPDPHKAYLTLMCKRAAVAVPAQVT